MQEIWQEMSGAGGPCEELQPEHVHDEWRALQNLMMEVADASAERRREAANARRAQAEGRG
eukprot:7158992-Prymnesium_polylepis.1